MASILHHIIPLVITSLRGEHTQTQTHRHIHTCGQYQFLATKLAPATGRRAPGLKAIHCKSYAVYNLFYSVIIQY